MGIYSEASTIELQVYDLLKTVIDPEVGVNIIDLGLVYKIDCHNENELFLEMTLSSKGCPMGDVIMDNIRNTIKVKFPQMIIDIKLVWEPAWSVNFVTPAGKAALGQI